MMDTEQCPQCQSRKIFESGGRLLYCSDCTWYKRVWQPNPSPEYALAEYSAYCCRAAYLLKVTIRKRQERKTDSYFVELFGYYTKGPRETADEIRAFPTEDEAREFATTLMLRLQEAEHVKYIKVGTGDSGLWVSMEDRWLTDLFTDNGLHPRAVIW